MNQLGHFCRELDNQPGLTRKQIARKLRITPGRCNTIARQAEELGYVAGKPRRLTQAGQDYLEQYRVKNAVILASAIDIRFVPFTHETPKSLMEVEGERIIERLIRQLHECGITDITIVVGYLAERYDYLIGKYGVKLVFNPEYASRANPASLNLVKGKLGGTYLLYSDQWIWKNIFHTYETGSWCACHWHEGENAGWCVQTDGKRRVRKLRLGGRDKLAMLGPVYITPEFAEKMLPLVGKAYEQPGSDTALWEQAIQEHMGELPFFANILPPGMVQDFETFDELRDFDTTYAEASGNKSLRHIAQVFGASESSITDMLWLDVGMTNQSFMFTLDGERYIYRIPGEGTDSFISRKQEADTYKAIAKLDISDQALFLDPASGIKITRYYPNSHNVTECDRERIRRCMEILRWLHNQKIKVDYHFNIEERLQSFEVMCRKVNCIHFEDFESTRERLQLPLRIIRECAEEKVLCHCDAATNNFLVLEGGSDIRLLDWEYSGMSHGVMDVAMFGVFSVYTPEMMDELLEWYYDRPATQEERKLCYCYTAVSGVLWSIWAEFRQYHGEDFGEYAMTNYRLGKKYLKLVYAMEAREELPPEPGEALVQSGVVKKHRFETELKGVKLNPSNIDYNVPII